VRSLNVNYLISCRNDSGCASKCLPSIFVLVCYVRIRFPSSTPKYYRNTYFWLLAHCTVYSRGLANLKARRYTSWSFCSPLPPSRSLNTKTRRTQMMLPTRSSGHWPHQRKSSLCKRTTTRVNSPRNKLYLCY
jgi:hypothetical protein